VDLRRFGLPYEPTVADVLSAGADLVTFSGDKLLGGPQAGIVVGRPDIVARIKRNPMKRALRVDKMTIAALSSVLRHYLDPDRLPERMPTLALLTRSPAELRALAERIAPPVRSRLGNIATVEIEPCRSQIGSGSLPVESLDSTALTIRPTVPRREQGAALNRIVAAFRTLPLPVIGRVQNGAFQLDLRCLVDETRFVAQLAPLNFHTGSDR
jgi:L-seryl-tRNA(Ser) seleniumtransferase